MSRLFYTSCYDRDISTLEYSDIGQVKGDELIATFIGTPSQTLGQALMHFTADAIESCRRRVSGEIPDVPEVIIENSKAVLDKPVSEMNKYTIVQLEHGFMIWLSDGPDRYVLVD